jgi:hypothetical protein
MTADYQGTMISAPHIKALGDPELRESIAWLAAFRSRSVDDRQVPIAHTERWKATKARAVNDGNQPLAKAVWCLETVATIQEHYLNGVARMKEGAYYAGWCELERAEINLHFLDSHLRDARDELGLELIRHQIKSFQGIYPYQLFISPEIWKKEVRCSVCNARVTPRSGCGHRVGEIYVGQLCGRVVTQAQMLAVSLVRVPVQKYSVVYPADPGCSGGEPNLGAYPSVSYVVDRLESPWDRFHFEWTQTRHPHHLYADVQLTDPCPCIAPNGTYAECCKPTEGVLRPHLVVAFEKEPPPEQQETVYI